MEIRFIVIIIVSLLTASCSSSKRILSGREVSELECGSACEETADEFNLGEALRENPLGPEEFDLQSLLSIPGFPRGLALRLEEVRKEKPSGKGWLALLTPPEKEMLYRYREYLVLPERPGARLSARILRDGLGSEGSERTEAFVSLLGGRWKARLRARISKEGCPASFYLSSSALRDAVRFHAGDFLPDFSLGLLFNGSFSYYTFSGGFPFRGYRWVVGRTSFYGPSLKGMASEAWIGRTRMLAFVGRPREYRSGIFSVEGEWILGGRFESRIRKGVIGSSVVQDPFAPGGRIFTFDYRWHDKGLTLGGEIAGSGLSRLGGAWGLSIGGRLLDISVLMHSIPFGFGNRFGETAGKRGGGISSQRGIAAVVHRRLCRRALMRASFERTGSGDGFVIRDKEVVRAEVLKRWKGGMIKLSWSSRRSNSSKEIPYPSDLEPSISKVNSLSLLLTSKLSGGVRMRLSAGCPWGDDFAGYLLAPSFGISSLSDHVRLRSSFSFYRSSKGTAVFYFYEPSLAGGYPWRTVSGNGCRSAFVVDSSLAAFTFSFRLVLGQGEGTEMGVQIEMKI